ncbi:MAG: hypothetical protein JWQ94_3392, partial [Tardiphaga sp.]|nr:hypothetical protein [Tardiphaga sp.]
MRRPLAVSARRQELLLEPLPELLREPLPERAWQQVQRGQPVAQRRALARLQPGLDGPVAWQRRAPEQRPRVPVGPPAVSRRARGVRRAQVVLEPSARSEPQLVPAQPEVSDAARVRRREERAEAWGAPELPRAAPEVQDAAAA